MASAPSSNLCAAWTPTAVSGTWPWTWSCSWLSWWSNASCVAQLAWGTYQSIYVYVSNSEGNICANSAADMVYIWTWLTRWAWVTVYSDIWLWILYNNSWWTWDYIKEQWWSVNYYLDSNSRLQPTWNSC
jgi:hypothetical protein